MLRESTIEGLDSSATGSVLKTKHEQKVDTPLSKHELNQVRIRSRKKTCEPVQDTKQEHIPEQSGF